MTLSDLQRQQILRDINQSLDELPRTVEKRTTKSAKLGNGQGMIDVPNRPGYVYVRPRGNQEDVTQVYAPSVRKLNNLQVDYRPDMYGINRTVGVNPVAGPAFMGAAGSAEIGSHAASHMFDSGDDMIWLDTRQITELLVHPTYPASLSVVVRGGMIKTIAGRASLLKSTEDLTALVPSTLNQQRIIVIGIDRSDGSITTVNGTAETFTGFAPQSIPFTKEEVADLINASADAYFDALMAVRLYFGQTSIQKWDCFCDCRGWGRQGVNPFEITDTGDWVGYPFFNNGALYPVRCTGEATAPPTVNDDESLGYQIGSWWAMSVDAGGLFDGVWFLTDPTDGAAVWVFQGTAYSEANTSNPPTDAELDAAFGAPATLGVGFNAIVNDNGGDTVVYHVATAGAAWVYTLMTVAL